MLIQIGLFFLSMATLAFEITLTRIFSVGQFYHFAFMIVSLALLGFGASGAVLTVFPRWGRRHPERTLAWLALGFAISAVGSYALTNILPFDSFSITWDPGQVGVLALHYLALATPFFCSGAAVGLLLAARRGYAAQTYFVNLVGSAAGCLVALVAPGFVGGPGVVLLSSGLASLATLIFVLQGWQKRHTPQDWLLPLLIILGLLALLVLPPSSLQIHLSPYKDLSYALNVPDAQVVWREWNAFSRVDLIKSPAIRSLPGLSYRYPGLPPRQDGLTVDGSGLGAIITDLQDLDFAHYLPGALAYHLLPSARALVLEAHSGLDILVAHALGAQTITAVEPNPLVVQAAEEIYRLPAVETQIETGRSYAHSTSGQFDIVTLSLTDPYRPIRSGAYSLAEDYRYTVEAFKAYLDLLRPGGILQFTRWLQTPPSEETRLFALAVTALEQTTPRQNTSRQTAPANALLFFRGYNTATVLVKPDGFSPAELELVREWLSERAFDLVYAPDVQPEEVNRYNVLPSPVYHEIALELLSAPDRSAWFDTFAFDVTPPTDDHPFFGHYFRWSQAEQIVQEIGQAWQPFGGAGYFVLLALLVLATVSALAVILLPLAAGRLVQRWRPAPAVSKPRPQLPADGHIRIGVLAYFGLIGLGFLLAEIPLVQHFMLFLGQPVYGLTAVLFAIFFFSGLGSWWSARIPHRIGLGALILVVLSYPLLMPRLFNLFLGQPLGLRMAVAVTALAPLGFLLGVPFPRGITWLEGQAPGLVPWAWGINGAASVVASVAAALLALSLGFSWALIIGAACYAGALITISVYDQS
jgi:SAM-dependent methyltransferase